jgi:hypothetical protein
MLPLLPAYHSSKLVNTIDTNDVDTQGHDTTFAPRAQRGRRHLMPALGCDGGGRNHLIVVVVNMVVPDPRVIREANDL